MIESNLLKIYFIIINNNSYNLFYGNSIELTNCFIQSSYSSISLIINNPQFLSSTIYLLQIPNCLYINTKIIKPLIFNFLNVLFIKLLI